MEIKKIVTGALEENCYVLSKDGTCLIVDPGSDSKNIKELVGDDKIIGVLVTHAHFDHIGAFLDAFLQRFSAGVQEKPEIFIPEGMHDPVVDGRIRGVGSIPREQKIVPGPDHTLHPGDQGVQLFLA